MELLPLTEETALEPVAEISKLDRVWEDFGGSLVRQDFRFDANFYCEAYSDIQNVGAQPKEHFDSFGRAEGRVGNQFQKLLLSTDPDVLHDRIATLITDPILLNLIENEVIGATELVYELISLGSPTDANISNFSSKHYLRAYPDIALAGIEPLEHYLKSGFEEKRRTLEDIRSRVWKGKASFDPSRPTCLICAHEFSRSGAPIVARDIAIEASKTHNVVAMAMRGGGLIESMKDACCRLIVSDKPFEDWEFFGAPELASIDFAILNSVETYAFAKPLVAAQVPFVAYIHEFADYILPPFKAAIMSFFADKILFSSEVVRQSWTGMLQDCGFDLELDSSLLAQASLTFSPISSDICIEARERLSSILGIECGSRRIVYGAGQVQIRKGTDLFILTAQQAQDIDPDTLFIWVGDGANHEDIAYGVWFDKHLREAKANDPDGNLFVLPAGEHYRDICKAADVLFLPSRLDPLPNVVFDAAKYGCSTVLFRGATGFDDSCYDGVLSLKRVDYGDLAQSSRALLKAPRKLSWRRYLNLNKPKSDSTIANVPIFEVIKNMLNDGVLGRPQNSLPDSSAVTPAVTPKVSILFRGNDGESETDDILRLRENKTLSRLRRRAVWSGTDVALQAIEREGGWIHKYSSIEKHFDLEKHDPALSNIATPINIHVHAHYLDGLKDDLKTITAYGLASRIVITTDDEIKAEKISAFGTEAGLNVEAQVMSNQGRDILPFLRLLDNEGGNDEDIWCHVHQKKSITSTEGGDAWRSFLLRIILGNKDHIASSIKRISDNDVGLVTAFDPYVVGWGGARRFLPEMERKFGKPLPAQPLLFPVGNMFWTRARIARDMFALFGQNYAWPNEPLPNDGTVYHLIERLWPAVTSEAGMKTVFIDRPETKRV